ncbi:MAG: hypothetical protein II089_05280, partial [Selenomonas sp.]|nr:hypothetical protein [Selenomonas sp.]
MAVTPPVAPTPPTPPSVPKVTIGGGGSVTESTVPQSGHQTDAERQETEARQAVARGDGALSKTTQERPEAKNAAQGQKENGNQQGGGNTVVQTDPQAAAAMQDATQQDQAAAQKSQTAQTAAAQQPSPLTTQGVGYWAFTFVSVAILAFVFFRVVMKKRRGGKGELSAEDIRQAMTPVEDET